jgi:hypothetical protein
MNNLEELINKHYKKYNIPDITKKDFILFCEDYENENLTLNDIEFYWKEYKIEKNILMGLI